ncbi:MAG: hypothetical protein K0S54_225 [Alphaproteobacteria bacterium]|nr:hypothetical protein [Alphaproteobacteria bacterium]
MISHFKRGLMAGCMSLALAVPLALPATAAPQGEVVVAGALLRQQFDPTIMVAVTDHTAFNMLYDGLLNLTDKGKVPALAESWTISADGLQMDFALRKNVKFHNGDPFTAEDVKYSYDLLLKFSSSRYGIQPIVPKNYYESVGSRGFQEKPIGTGPYKLVETKAGEWSRFEANAEYWGKVSNVKFVTQKLIKEPFTLYAMLEKGEADVVFGLTGALLDRVKTNKELKIFESKYSGTSGIYFNTTKFPEAKDKRVRMAVAYAINREAIAKNVLSGVCQPATSIFTPGTFGHNPDLKPIPYDPAKAKALLAEAGIKPGTEITWALHTESFGSLPSAPQVTEAIAGNLAAVGFKVNREQHDTASFLAMMRGKKQTGLWYGPSSMPDDGGETLEGWYSSTAVWSSGHINEPEYDTVFKAQLGTTDLKKREKMLQDWAKLEDEKRTAVPLFWCNTTYAAGPRVKSWAPAVISAYHYNFNTMELAK